jgi:hypothetical protein
MENSALAFGKTANLGPVDKPIRLRIVISMLCSCQFCGAQCAEENALRTKVIHYLILFSLLSPGCALVGNATHNVLLEVHHAEEDRTERRRDRLLAEQAWQHVQATGSYSESYGDGFVEGFADFLYAGGNGEPPALPPQKYWKSSCQTPEGHRSTEDWFAGFRHGAAEARKSGYRQWMTMPSSLVDGHLGRRAYDGPQSVPAFEAVPEPIMQQPQPLTAAPLGTRAEHLPAAVAPRGVVLGVRAIKRQSQAAMMGIIPADLWEPLPQAKVVRVVAGSPRPPVPEGN